MVAAFGDQEMLDLSGEVRDVDELEVEQQEEEDYNQKVFLKHQQHATEVAQQEGQKQSGL